jgi:putative hemolysin
MSAGVQIAFAVLVGILLVGSGLLAAAETALIRTTRVRAKSLADDGRRGAHSLESLVAHPERFLNPLLLMVLVCQLVSATLLGLLADHWFGAWGVLAATVFEVVVIFVFFEAVPKNWAVHHPDAAALGAAPLVNWLIHFPPIRALSAVLIGLANLVLRQKGTTAHLAITESELLAMADVAGEENVIDAAEREFIHSVIDFGDTIVREVMVPRTDMEAISSTISVSDALVEALEAGFSRLPVYAESIDDVAGVAFTKDLIVLEREGRGDELVGEHVRPPYFVPETKKVSTMIKDLRAAKLHMAVVVDEYGGTAGLVTLEDILEELVGEIVDEFDLEVAEVEQIDERTWVVPGKMLIDDLDDLIGSSLPKEGFDTIGGLVLDLAAGVPAQGDAVEVDGLRLVAARVENRRIDQVRVERLVAAET